MHHWNLITLSGIALMTASCQHPEPPAVDVVSAATMMKHEIVVHPPTNSLYQVYAHQEGLKNYLVKYDDQVYRGGEIYIEDLALEVLEGFQIKTIISVTPTPEERAFCSAHGFNLVEVPFDATGPTAEDFKVLFAAFEEDQGPYYMHCKGGTHRAGILGAAYRMGVQGWSFDQAVIEYGRLGGDLKSDHVLIEKLRPLAN
jgi:protein tyrosine/serine phosphatase